MPDEELLARLVGWLRPLLPDGFEVQAAPADLHWPIPEADRQQVARAVPQRQAEFIGGRWCAHAVLGRIGMSVPALPAGPLRAPLWPDGVIGSITHERRLCLAVAGRSGREAGIGIDLCDLERYRPVAELAPMILAPGEAGGSANEVLRVFSAKEAVVKAISRHMGRYLDLREIVIRRAPHEGRFGAEIAGRAWTLQGHQAIIDGLVASFAILAGPLS